MFDTYHVIYCNEVSSDYVRRMGADLHHIHLADENRAAPSNGGRADYRAIISDLKALDFKGYLTMEIGFDHRSSDPDRFAREAFDYIKPLIGRP